MALFRCILRGIIIDISRSLCVSVDTGRVFIITTVAWEKILNKRLL